MKIPRPLQVDLEVLNILLIIGKEHSGQYKECLEPTLGGLHDSNYILKATFEDEHVCF